MSELFEKRRLFSSLIPKLLNKMIMDGYDPLIGKDGLKHKENSLHYEGLAMDINLFKNGVYLTKTEDYRLFGEFWESLHQLCRWGGRFGSSDGNHFSIYYQGRQ